MFEVEFETQVKNGVIEIPEQYKSEITEGVDLKVTVILKKLHKTRDIFDEFRENPIKVDGKLTREEIYDRKL